MITVDITADCADGDKIVLTYKGTSAVIMGATQLVVKTANAGDVSPVTAIASSPTITVTPAANITINNAKVISPNSILVTFNNPGSDLTGSPDFSKWHIDVNTGGSSPLNPTSATITSATAPWTITLTFADTPFSDSSISYDASHGLYVEAIGISDVIGDTNVVLADTSSMAVSDGQVPTLTSVVFADNDLAVGETSLVTFTFSEPITDFSNADLTVVNGVLSAITVDGIDSKIYTATFTPTASIEDATNIITVDMTGVTDIIGNIGVGTTDSNNYAIHTTPSVSTTNSSGGRRHFGCNDPKALNYEYFSASDSSLCVYSKISTTTSPVVTPKLPSTGFPPRR